MIRPHSSRDSRQSKKIKENEEPDFVPDYDLLTDEEKLEAERIKKIAERAEKKFEQKNKPSIVPLFMLKQLEPQKMQDSKSEITEDGIKYIDPVARDQLSLERIKTSNLITEKQRERSQALIKRETEVKEKRRAEDEKLLLRQRTKEYQQLHDFFLGTKKEKKRTQKPSEKFRNVFKFEWDKNEDTTDLDNYLYRDKADVKLGFGKGFIGGVDMVYQTKHNDYALELNKLRLASTQADQNEFQEYIKLKDEMEKEHQRQILALENVTKSWKDKTLDEMTERDWRIFREDYNIVIEGGLAPNPIRSWKESNISDPILSVIKELGFKKPTPIQMLSIPAGLTGKDILGIAETGSGKTLAYVVPLLNYVMNIPDTYKERCYEDGPLAIVLAPTRELADQIYAFICLFEKSCGIIVLNAIGGVSAEAQTVALHRGVQIIVGTVGRINDLIDDRKLVLNQCNYIVLDEADTMIDLGFEEHVKKLLRSMRSPFKSTDENLNKIEAEQSGKFEKMYRTTVMFTATMEPKVELLAKEYLRCPVFVTIGGRFSHMNLRITQIVHFTKDATKLNDLIKVLREYPGPIILFVNTRDHADTVSTSLKQSYFKVTTLHAGKSVLQREEGLQKFKERKTDILIATDVVSRGLDIPDIEVVINYDCPNTIQKYTHRIGRTARAGKSGVAITFLTEDDVDIYYDLRNYLINAKQNVPKELDEHPRALNRMGIVEIKSVKDKIVYANTDKR